MYGHYVFHLVQSPSDKIPAKLSFHLNSWICLYTDEYLGNCLDVSSLFRSHSISSKVTNTSKDEFVCPDKWRHGGNDMGLFDSLDRLYAGVCDHC
jgi:hypothetical protein